MSDLAIKLFGKTIPFASSSSSSSGYNNSEVVSSADENDDDGAKAKENLNQNHQDRACFADLLNKDGEGCTDVELKMLDKEDTCKGEQTKTKQRDAAAAPPASEQFKNTETASVVNENSKLPPRDKGTAAEKVSKPEEDQSDTSTSQEKTLKKPDKKISCPRCNSMDTKFCYYNNYNVNQPRYFCKKCQRYWTDGGTMRNVPVGAGRRKSKNSAPHYRHITVAESLQNAQNHLQNSVHHPSLNANGTVLTFGSDTPLCESMASVLSLAQKSMRNCAENVFHAPQEIRIASSYGGGESSSEHSNASSVSASGSKDEKKKTALPDSMMHNGQGFTPTIACFPGVPWPYPWNPAQWTPSLAQPAFCPPGYPMPFYPTPGYCGCPVLPTWNASWVPQPSSPKVITTGSGPDSPTLGKHSRDENLSKADESGGEKQSKECGTGRSLWIPKTLRIDDPGEAAESSIWTTLGIKKDKSDPISSSGGLYKAFRTNCDEKNAVSRTSLVLQANPAALSRSLNFQESS